MARSVRCRHFVLGAGWSTATASGVFSCLNRRFSLFSFVPLTPDLSTPQALLFATRPPTALAPRTYGQIVSPSFDHTMATSSFPAASCPCCSFVRDGLFLPWNDVGQTEPNTDDVDQSEKNATQSTDVISPVEAWKIISSDKGKHQVLLVDTHGHPHLEREIEYADTCDDATEAETAVVIPAGTVNRGVVSLTCAVSPSDWNDALKYAAQSPFQLPALGVHPWYLGDILIENDHIEELEKHLRWDWLTELENHLSQHPNLIVGEIGLCKMAKFVRDFPKEQGGKATALQLQKLVFRKQMELAAKWSRPVTVHCVNMHKAFLEVMNEILQQAKESYNSKHNESDQKDTLQHCTRSAFPPAIAMHSFTGTAQHVQDLLCFEREVMDPDQLSKTRRVLLKQKKQTVASVSPEETSNNRSGEQNCLFYFGFSHAVNHRMCTSEKARRKGIEAVSSVPSDRLLVESDVHATADVALGTAGAVAYVAFARGDLLRDVAEQATRNGLRYLSSSSLRSELINQ
eukprot:CCRYP_013100-RB/>CCRYP_013100-RB protein AED:0.02 eAED:0.02 QI:3462/1/1/1/0.33/0/4/1622/514